MLAVPVSPTLCVVDSGPLVGELARRSAGTGRVVGDVGPGTRSTQSPARSAGARPVPARGAFAAPLAGACSFTAVAEWVAHAAPGLFQHRRGFENQRKWADSPKVIWSPSSG